MGTTANGLRYPGPQDLLADTPVHINNLRDDVAGQLAAVNYVQRQLQVGTDGNGLVTVNITDFATLRGVVVTYLATPGNIQTMMALLTQLQPQWCQLQLFYMDRGTAAGMTPGTHPYPSSAATLAYLAWGDPR